MITLQFFPRKGYDGHGSFGFTDDKGSLVSINPFVQPLHYNTRGEAILEAWGMGYYVDEENRLIAQA